MKTLSVKNLYLEMQDTQSPAIYSSAENLSYGELKERVNRVIRKLIELDVDEGDHVAILGKSEAEFISIIIALWKLGAVPVPLNTRLSNKELSDLILRSDCKIILSDNSINRKKYSFPVGAITYPFTTAPKEKFESDFQPPFDSTAVIIFTSGSSSVSKAVELSFKSLYESAKIGNKILAQTSDDRWLASLPFYHVSGFSIIVRALLFGASIILPDSNSVEDILTSMDMYQPTLCSLVPTQLKRIIEIDFDGKENIRQVLVGGGHSSEDLILSAFNRGWNITKVYGSTETCAFVTALTGDEILHKPKSSGKALSPNIIKVINRKGLEVIEGEFGEIVINTPAVMKAYYKNEEEFKKSFKDEFYLTGDLGYLDDEGYLFVEARRTDLIVSGGENVNAVEVESAILSHPDIDEAAVFPMTDEEWGQLVTAVVVMKNSKNNLSLNELNNFLKKDLADFKLPKKLIIERELPKSDLGKIEKEKLITRYRL